MVTSVYSSIIALNSLFLHSLYLIFVLNTKGMGRKRITTIFVICEFKVMLNQMMSCVIILFLGSHSCIQQKIITLSPTKRVFLEVSKVSLLSKCSNSPAGSLQDKNCSNFIENHRISD